MIANALLYDALLLRYPRDQYVVIQEVAISDAGRRADAVAIALWASRGREVQGFEVKASRSDWLRELKDAAKAESVFQYCDRFWLIAARSDIVMLEEVPGPWGVLVLGAREGKPCLRTLKQAPKLKPKPMPWQLVCRMLRRTQDAVRELEAQDKAEREERALARARAEVREKHEAELRTAASVRDEAIHALRAAEDLVGCSLNEWNHERLRKAAALERNGLDAQIKSLTELRDRLNEILLDQAPQSQARLPVAGKRNGEGATT